MSTAPKRLSGTASGINTAINSTANVLSVAILGALALNIFNASVDRQLQTMDLPAQTTSEIKLETPKLANAQAPDSLPTDQRVEVDRAFDLAFVDAFRVLMYVCAGLVVTAALVSLLMIEGKPPSEATTKITQGLA
jgi:hypothetical protein